MCIHCLLNTDSPPKHFESLCNLTRRISMSAIIVAISAALGIPAAFRWRVAAIRPSVSVVLLVFPAMSAPRPRGRSPPVVVPFSRPVPMTAMMTFPISVTIIVVSATSPFSISTSVVAAIPSSLSAWAPTAIASVSPA